jgi:CheY-like chemotaxis protein
MSTILVIDDHADLRTCCRQFLEAEGHRVREAADGAQGLRAHRQRPVDLVLCDNFMPRKEGLETVRQLRREFPDLRIVAMSGGGRMLGKGFLSDALLFGAKAALEKPFGRDQLLEVVRAALPTGADA